MYLPITPHKNISFDGIPTSWGAIPDTGIEIVNSSLTNVMTHYIADNNAEIVFKVLKLLDDKYPDCELSSSETVNAVIDYMASWEDKDERELSSLFREVFWGE